MKIELVTIGLACLAGILLSSSNSCYAKGSPDMKGHRVIQAFDYKGVKLEGNLRRQFDEVCEYYLRIPNDDLLKPYRKRAGKADPGRDMGGVYVTHQPFGQFLGGYSRMYAATGDSVYKDKAISLMNGWAECIEPDGFFFPDRKPELIPYYYEKMLGGLLDIYVYCGDKNALKYLSKITDWAVKNISRVRQYANPITNDGGEWYTLSENLYRAYMLTSDDKYKEFAQIWEYKDYWDFFAKNRCEDIFTRPGWYHAYSHVNTFSGLGAAYIVKGEPYYLNALKNAYDYIFTQQCWATGGYGPDESLLPHKELVKKLSDAANHFETQCGSWAGFKMTKYLITLTGDARYGDWTELLVLNGIGASIPMDGTGRVFYYSEYNTGGSAKKNIEVQWPCCSGSRPEAVSDYHDIIYFKDDKNIYVNLYTASSVDWKTKNHNIKICQQTRFPENEVVRFVVTTDSPAKFGLKLRIPGWLSDAMSARINGHRVELKNDSSNWAVVDRRWNDGDILEVRLPMDLHISHIDPDVEYPAAIMYGPVALAVRSASTNPAGRIDLNNIKTELVRNEGEVLTWHFKSDPSILVRPFYAFKEGERYFLYLDSSAPMSWAEYSAAQYTGKWTDFNGWMTTSVPGSSAEYTFAGRGIRVHYYKYDDAGILEVKIDGVDAGKIDEYGSLRGEKVSVDYTGLEPGKHTIQFILKSEKSTASKGIYVNLAAFESIR